MNNLRAEVTAQIIKAIENGTPPWRAGWTRGQPHRNGKTGKGYQGVNQLLLSMTPFSTDDPRWLTFKQAMDLGCKVVKGAHGVRIIKMVEVSINEARKSTDVDVLAQDQKTALVMRAYTVFNASQIDGLPPLPEPTNKVEPIQAIDAIADGMKGTGLVIKEMGDQPAYVPALDVVRMPRTKMFHSTEDHYSTLFHELSHATSHKNRLNRDCGLARFGTELYAKEELRAELASTFLCAQVGLPMGQSVIDQHASYLSSWLEILGRDKNEIFKAAAESQRICDYLAQWIPQPALMPTTVPVPEPTPAIKAKLRM